MRREFVAAVGSVLSAFQLIAGCAAGDRPDSEAQGGAGGKPGRGGAPNAAGSGVGNASGNHAAGSEASGDAGGSAGGHAGGQTSGAVGGMGGTNNPSGGASGSAGADPGPPNILIVLLDDMGYSDLGTYGGEIRTPNIDQLAEQGTRFRNFYVTPRCSPTRMSLLTGQYTQQVATMPGASLPPLRTDNNVILPELLSRAGYRTYMAGKWHLGAIPEQRPRNRGFEHVFGLGPNATGAGANKWKESEHSLRSKDNAIAKRTYGDVPGDFYQPAAMGDYALDYLKYHFAVGDNAPFFMYLAYNSPHFAIQAPKSMVESAPPGAKSYEALYGAGWNTVREQRYARMLETGVIDASFRLSPSEPSSGQNIPLWSALTENQRADLTRKMALYAASIESVDVSLGRVVARLKQLGQFENTLIFVLSDNGGNAEGGVVGTAFGDTAPLTGARLANMGQPQQDDRVLSGGGWANVQNTPFRFYKHFTHGGGVRSPLVVSWPARTAQPGSWTDQVAHVIDVAPTILDAARVPHPQRFAGHPVLPLEGTTLMRTLSKAVAPEPRQLGFEHESNRAWIDGEFKLVVRHENADKVELYNLETDPAELNDLAAAQPARVTAMVKAWNAWAERVGVPADRLLPSL